MPKKTLITVLALAALAAGLIYAKTRAPQEIAITPDSQSLSEVITEAQKFAAAIESGNPYTCEITGENTTMTYQFMGGKMYMTATQDKVTTHALNDTEWLYTWQEGAAQGIKTAIPSEEEVQAMTKDVPTPSEAPSFASEQDYQSYQDLGYTITCSEGGFGSELFTPPANVEFTDPTALLQEAIPNGASLDMSKLEEMAKQYEGLTPPTN